jgi:predicted metal-dependent HD superfamily phosphohydrolase
LNELNLISEAHLQALKLIECLDSNTFLYHDKYHTEQVAKVGALLAADEGCSDKNQECVTIAAWFHDTGYTNVAFHEQESTINAQKFLNQQGVDGETVKHICRLILATKINHVPVSLDEQIIRDADLHYLGLDSYEQRANLLRLEWERSLDRKLSDKEWFLENVKFFESHTFYTESAKARFDHTKAKNLDKIRNLLLTS